MFRVKTDKPAREKQAFRVPRSAQQSIPIRRIHRDGTWEFDGGMFSRTWRLEDTNYTVSDDEQKNAFLGRWGSILNGLPIGATTKITIANHRLNQNAVRQSVFLPERADAFAQYRTEYNQMVLDKARGSSGIVQDKFITLCVQKRDAEEARTFLHRVGSDFSAMVKNVHSAVYEMDNTERLRILHDFFRIGAEAQFSFDFVQALRHGESFKDRVCPHSLRFHSDHFELENGKVGRVLLAEQFEGYILDSLIRDVMLQKNMLLSVDIVPVSKDWAVKEIQRKELAGEANAARWQQRQNSQYNFAANLPTDLREFRNTIDEYMDDLTTKGERMMFVTMTLVHVADDMKELDADTESILSSGRTSGCTFYPMLARQEDGLNTVLPYGARFIRDKRTMTTRSTAALVPFSAQEIQQQGGVFYGVNAVTSNLIVINRKESMNGNGFILGVSGSGKSFAAKTEITSVALATNDDILVIDPEREYIPLIQELGGQVVRIAAGSENHINALDLSRDCDMHDQPILRKAEFVLSLCEQIMGVDRIGAHEKSIIDRCVSYVFEDYIMHRTNTAPTLRELHNMLLQQAEPEAHAVALALELFTQGNLNVFAHHSNVNMSNRIMLFDILDLGKQLKTVGMLVTLDAVLNRVMENRKKGRRTWIYIDEIYLLFANEYSSNFLSESWKRFRKYGGLATGITQNVDDCLRSDLARTMLSNSEFLLLLNQSPTDRAQLAHLLQISSEQEKYITDVKTGHGLIKAAGTVVPFINDFPRDTGLYRLMTTKPGEN